MLQTQSQLASGEVCSVVYNGRKHVKLLMHHSNFLNHWPVYNTYNPFILCHYYSNSSPH